MSQPVGAHVGELGQLSPTHRYWQACLSAEAATALHGCGRIIGARVSREHTAAAHYFRSIALASLGEDRRALRDLRRAYFSFVDILFEDDANALALYGRGLSLVRMGHEAEGRADMAAALAISQGRAERFFDLDG